jgi:hypothetical protein
VDGDKKSLCEIYKQIVIAVINAAMDLLVSGFSDGIGGVLTSKIFNAVERDVKKIGNYRMIKTLDKVLTGFENVEYSGFRMKNDFDKIADKLSEFIKSRETTMSTIITTSSTSLKRLTELERESRHAKALYEMFTTVHFGGSGNDKRALERTVNHIIDYGSPIRVLRARGATQEQKVKAHRAINSFKSLHKFNTEEKLVEWELPLAKNMANSLGIFPMFHIPGQWLSSLYHPNTVWGTDIAGADDPPEWRNERMRENLKLNPTFDADFAADFERSLHNTAYRDWPRKKFIEKDEQVKSGRDGTLQPQLPTIVGGLGHGWICSDFEGDWTDHNEVNIDMLKNRVAMELEAGRRQVWSMFKDMYDGVIIEPGRPSMVARWMLARDWVGKDQKGTIEYDLHHVEDFHK